MTSASAVLGAAIAAHGGWRRWREVSTVTAVASAEGATFWPRAGMRSQMKAAATDAAAPGAAGRGSPSSVTTGWELTVTASTREIRSWLDPFPDEGTVGVFSPSEVRVETPAGDVRVARTDPMTDFAAASNERSWDDLRLLYFTGYSFWNYLTTPFLLARPDVDVSDGGPWTEPGGERWQRVDVRFPAGIPTHSPSQTCYFDDEGLLRRLDYDVSFLGGAFGVAHYCADHLDRDGFRVPSRRWVVPRRPDGRARTGPVLLSIGIRDAWLG